MLVLTHPTSQAADALSRTLFYCSFQNAGGFHWYKDAHPMKGSENTSPLVINPTLPEDQGYYSCRGSDESGGILETEKARLIVNGMSIHSLTHLFTHSVIYALHIKLLIQCHIYDIHIYDIHIYDTRSCRLFKPNLSPYIFQDYNWRFPIVRTMLCVYRECLNAMF